VTKFDTVIALNQQSLDKFENSVKPGGLLIYDPNGVMNPPTRTDIKICKIDAINVAAQVGNSKVYNMAVMCAYLKMKPIILSENIDKGLAKCIPARYADLIALNKQAIEEGMKAVEEL
jgi:2-oxoglutarate ferredoxin oxidoreductase subunit gamma